MSSNLDRLKKDLDELVTLGLSMVIDFRTNEVSSQDRPKAKGIDEDLQKETKGIFKKNYQSWYSESISVIKQLLPDRLAEFILLYHDPKRKERKGGGDYVIHDWVTGFRSTKNARGDRAFKDDLIIAAKLLAQYEILKSAESRFNSSLFDIRQLVSADLLDSELAGSRELVKHGFLRAAGVIAGVVIEKHLLQVCNAHNIKSKKSHPTMSEFNDLLKNGGVVDVPTWRQIQRLGDIRNMCAHGKEREPTKDEVNELIDGADKICKTLF